MWSFDGSFALYTTRGLTYKDGVVASYSQNGGSIAAETLTDTNGNFINCAFTGGNPFFANPTGCTDTLGRHITYTSDPVTGLAGSMTYLDSSGVSRSVTFHYLPFTLKYPFADGNSCNDRGDLHTPAGTYLVTSVTLANGLSYGFEYFVNGDGTTTGEITKIILPTGGYIRYDYGFGPASTDGNLICVFQGNPQNRIVKNRFVSPDGTVGSEQTWSYVLTQLNDTLRTQVMTVTDPLGNSQVYSRAYGSPLPYQTDYKNPSGTVLKSVRGEVESAPGASQYLYSTPAFVNARYKSLTTVLSDTNQQSKTTFTYGSFNNVVEKDETDLGTGAPGPILRKSTYSYLNDFNSAYAGDNVHILDRARNVTVCDAGSIFCSQSTTDYDTTAINSTSSNPVGQHDYTNYSTANTRRGNPTQISRFLNTTGGNVMTTHIYNDVGNLLQVTDPNLNVTSFDYTDNYANGTPSQRTSAYATQVTRPVTSGVSHITRSQYYFNTGLTAATCGENFPSGTACASGLTGTRPDYQSITYDLMGRPLVAAIGDGGQTTLTYNEASLPINIGTSTKIDSTHNLTQTTVYDGLGRLSQTQLTSDPSGTTYQLTTYDSLGRKSQVFNPTRCNPPGTNCGEATWGYSSFTYDGLGRVVRTTAQDGGIVSSVFKGNATTVTDQAGKQRRSISNGLGQLVEVDEPGTQPPPQVNHATMQTDGNFVLYNSSNSALWSTGTGGTNAQSIMMQDDGNLVLYIFKWSAGVYAAPSPGPFPPQTCGSKAYLVAGQSIHANECIVSPHGQYILYMAPNGNFYIYDIAHNVATWAPGTSGNPGAYAVLQTDGNLVVYSAGGGALWSSGTNGTYAERLDMEDDGRIIVYKSAWNSATSTGQFNWTQLTHPGCDVGTGTGWTGTLGSGQCFVSPNGHFELLVQTDGNLVINDLGLSPANTLWATGTGITPLSPGYALATKYSYDGLGNLSCVEQHGDAATGTGCSDSVSSDSTSPWRVRRFVYDTLSRLTSSSNPESNTATVGASSVRVNTTYTYDANSNLLQKTSLAPNQTSNSTQTLSYCYDSLNRLTGKKYAQQTCPLTSPVASYLYDQTSFNGLTIVNGIGRRTGMNDQAGAEAWSYDSMGRPAADRRTIGSVTKSTTYAYNLSGSPTSIGYPSGSTITYAYNNAAQAISAVDTPNSINYATLATYSPVGSLSSLKNGTNLTSTFYYNNRLQPCRIFVSTGASTPSNCADLAQVGNIQDFAYNFSVGAGDNGNVTAIANNRDTTRNQSFAYDSLNRVSSAQTSATTGTKCFGESFGYDTWGNLLAIGGVSGYSTCTQENLGAPANVKNQISTNAYDAAGNMTTGGYTYDAENHLLTAGGVTYTYDGDGKRVQKSSGKMYWYGMMADALDETDATGSTTNSAFNEYIFFGGKRLARRNSSNAVFYYFADHLGTSRVMVQAGQTTPCYDADFYPFGGERAPLVNTCSQNYKFTGKERDAETGLDKMGARFYSSGVGRFNSTDPLMIQRQKLLDPQQWSMYQYARNNPLRYRDPTGKYVCADSAKCDSKQDKAFEQSRQHDLKSKDANVVRAARAYGDPTKDNGTTVKFGDTGHENGTTTAGTLRQDPDHPGQFQAVATVTIKSGISGTALDAAVGHEGTHVADAQDFAATVSADLAHYDYSKNLTKYQTEVNAYRVTQAIQAAANEKVSYGEGCTGGQCIFGPGVRNIDEVINQLLAAPANGYSLTPDNQGGRQFPEVPPPPNN
jgi:RHS repeat-associated protein